MASIFDMSSGRIQPENSGVTHVTDHLEIGPALQEVRELPEDATRGDNSQHHIRELLKEF